MSRLMSVLRRSADTGMVQDLCALVVLAAFLVAVWMWSTGIIDARQVMP